MKKRCAALLAILTMAFITGTSLSAETENGSASLLSDVVLTVNGRAASPSLTDGKILTSYTFAEGERLEISASSPIHYLYLQFAKIPSPYTISYEKETWTAGEQGFLHEVLPITDGADSISLSLSGLSLCGISAYGEGSLPDDVQQWQPPLESCDLLVFPTHADDDTLYFGPLIALSVQQGYTVQAVFLTHHWREPERPHELLDGLWEMGVTAYPVISNFPDKYSRSLEHASTLYNTDKVLGFQVEQLRRFKPKVVAGHDLKGEYGHGVHMLNAHLLMDAVEKCADPTAFPESAQKWGIHQPQKTYLHNYPQNQILLNVDQSLSRFGGRTAFQVAETAYAKHLSQQKWGFAVVTSGVEDCRPFGLIQSTVGEDTGNDPFENVVFPRPTETSQPTQITASTTASLPAIPSVSSPIDNKGGSFSSWFPVTIIAGVLLLTVMAILLSLHFRRRQR